MFDDVYQSFEDPDGNFVEQFQTTGFNARCFELYLFAYFSRSGFTVDRSNQNPDFLVSRDGLTVAVEATTVNPSTSGILARLGKRLADLRPDELREYQRHELPIRFGSPLYSKLQAKYWELDHCRNRPFVIAIEAFHDEEALGIPDSALAGYLFGLEQNGAWDEGGKLQIKTRTLKEHIVGEKTVPSNFFGQPGAENISAVMFTNSGTAPKFCRMGYQHGIGMDSVEIVRTGFCFNPDPDALDPTLFSYTLDEPPLVESWGQGLVVLHNPKCLYPVPRDFFVDGVQGYLENHLLKFDHRGWHPFASKTFIFHMGDVKKEVARRVPRRPRVTVNSISRDEFCGITGIATDSSHPVFDEQGWFADETGSFLGIVVRDRIDDDWGYVVLARDKYFVFRALETEVSMATRLEARRKMQLKILQLLSAPQRIFAQDN